MNQYKCNYLFSYTNFTCSLTNYIVTNDIFKISGDSVSVHPAIITFFLNSFFSSHEVRIKFF